MAYTLDANSGAILREDHATVAQLARPQSKGVLHGKGSPAAGAGDSPLLTLVIVGAYQTSTQDYPWSAAVYDPSAAAWSDAAGGINSTALGNAVKSEGAALLVRGTMVDGRTVHVLVGGGAGFPVDLVQVGGADGNNTTTPPTYASWTYDVKAKGSSTVLAAAVAVEKHRYLPGPTTKGTKGWAYWHEGTLVLWDTNEYPAVVKCSTGGGA